MRNFKIRFSILFSFTIIFSAVITAAEDAILFTTPTSLINMYKSGNSLGVNHKLSDALFDADDNIYHASKTDAEFLKIESAYRSGDKDIKNKLIEYKKNNNDLLYSQRIELMLANTYLSEGDFESAEKCFEKIDGNRLSSQELEEYVIKKSMLKPKRSWLK